MNAGDDDDTLEKASMNGVMDAHNKGKGEDAMKDKRTNVTPNAEVRCCCASAALSHGGRQ